MSPDAAQGLSDAIERVAAEAIPAVVYVRADKGRRLAPEVQEVFLANGLPAVPFVDDEVVREASGSGVIVTADGQVLTNHHVVEGALAITLVMSDQRRVPARVVAMDPRTDLALLAIDVPGKWPHLDIADAPVRPGQLVVAIGNPFDFQSTVSVGVVSAVGRSAPDTREIQDYIQTDAAINPGNSGGPLLDLRGDVVGINTAIFAPEAEQNAGISFAIPAPMAERVLADVVARRVPRRAWIGLVPRSVEHVEGDPTRRGAEVDRVWPGSPAEAAGLRRGDTVTAVDGRPVPTADALRGVVRAKPADARLAITVQRDERSFDVTVPVGDERTAALGTADVPSEAVLWAGLTLVDPVGPWLARYGVPMGRGALVIGVTPRSPAARMGLAAGDVLLEIEGEGVNDVASLRARVTEAAPAEPGATPETRFVPVRIERAGSSFYALIPG